MSSGRHRVATDRGTLMVPLMLLVVIVLGGSALVVDGGRAMVARRHAVNVAEGAARAAVSTATPVSSFDPAAARRAALDHAARSGIAARDVSIEIGSDWVEVTIVERRMAVFLVLGGWSEVTVRGVGIARVVWVR